MAVNNENQQTGDYRSRLGADGYKSGMKRCQSY
jgi:hypothetical protein